MNKRMPTLILGFLFLVANPVYPKPIVRCNANNGVARIDLPAGQNLPIKFGRIGPRKDGVILWGSALDGHTLTMTKVGATRRLKAIIGSDQGRFYIRWKNGATVPMDSSSFKLAAGVRSAPNGDLLMCGYIPPTPIPAPTPVPTESPNPTPAPTPTPNPNPQSVSGAESGPRGGSL